MPGIINAGVGGNNSRALLARLEEDVLSRDPSLVIIMVGTNDALNSEALVPLDEYRENLDLLVGRCIASGSRVLLATIIPFHEPALMTRHQASAYGEMPPTQRHAAVINVIRDCSQKHSLPLAEVNTVFTALGSTGEDASSLLRNPANSGVVDGVQCGKASMEYEGLFRVVEHTGRQAAVIDLVHSPAKLIPTVTPFVILPGSPVIHRETARALESYVALGGKLVVSGPWPVRNDLGTAIAFLGGFPVETDRAISKAGGTIWWVEEGLGRGLPEEDCLESIAWLAAVLDQETSPAKALIETVEDISWIDWNTGKNMKSEGGHRVYPQPRNLCSAILHEGPQDRILFALNHYPVAARVKITLADASRTRLVDLDSGVTIPLNNGSFELDLDRKSASIFRVG